MLRAFALAFVLLPVAADEFSGALTVREVLVAPPGTKPEPELVDLEHEVATRIDTARSELSTARGAHALMLRRDLGFLLAEQERIRLLNGGENEVQSGAVAVRGGRALLRGGGYQIAADRATGTAVVLGGGRRLELPLVALPDPPAPGPAGPEIDGRPTRRVSLRAGGRELQALVLPDLPNPFAQLIVSAGGIDEDDPLRVLAGLPGLPVRLEFPGEVVRRIEVQFAPRAVADAELVLQ